MKVKKFDNLWTMGLILCCAILVAFYIAKLIFPEWIIGVAEIPSIVEIGNYIDAHWWSYNLYELISGFLVMYIYCCACCRVKKLTPIDMLVLVIFVVFVILSYNFFVDYYFGINMMMLVACPLVICLLNKKVSKETFISTSFCFIVDGFSQILSLEIRDITTLTTNLNTATIAVLTIDLVIWRVLMYLYFNAKEEKSNG